MSDEGIIKELEERANKLGIQDQFEL